MERRRRERMVEESYLRAYTIEEGPKPEKRTWPHELSELLKSVAAERGKSTPSLV